MVLTLGTHLELDRCPHCGVDRPSLENSAAFESKDFTKSAIAFGKPMCVVVVAVP